ncbi:ATP-binding protein [Halobaculum marinum]|uniref:ATP-binding protein n=1 Tax=Halobaculum marinum TaxID=3031996 RepID=A0ABD5WUG9_9EURY|nr:ATP-binding protein [Halobaculum sp. DT55]
MVSITDLRADLGPVSPTKLGSFVKLERCDQYLAWEYLADDLFGDGRFDKSLLSPLYAETGTRFEEEQLTELLEQRLVHKSVGVPEEEPESATFDETWEDLSQSRSPWDTGIEDVLELIKEAQRHSDDYTIVCSQAHLSGQIGAWELAGKSDIIVIRSDSSGSSSEIVVDILEVKSSKERQTHHLVQAACYSILLRQATDRDEEISGTVSFEGRVVTRSNAITERGYSGLEEFELGPTETDIEMLLRDGGRLDQILFESTESGDADDVEKVDAWDMTNRMSRRCSGCDFHDVCYTRAVEEDGLELLGFPEGTQEDLHDEGVETLGDLGELVDYGKFTKRGKQHQYIYPNRRTSDQVRIRDEELFSSIRDDVGLKDLERYAIAADIFSTEGGRNRPSEANMIPDSGYNLPAGEPEDSPLPGFLVSYPNRSLIRVYLYVQEDTIRERISLLGGYVTNHQSGSKSARYVSAITDDLPGAIHSDAEHATVDDKDETERRLLRRFLRGGEDSDGLIDAIRQVAPNGVELGDEDTQFEVPGFVHIYLYSPTQRQSLTRAAKRHAEHGEEFEALRTLLGLRSEIGEQDIDQEMVSVLQEEFVSRHLLRFLGFGLIQTIEQFERPDPDFEAGPPDYRTDEGESLDFSWWHEVEGETSLPLNKFFGEHLFDSAVEFDLSQRVSFDLENGLKSVSEGENYSDQFPFAHRHTDTIPLEYLWAAFDVLDTDWIDPDAFDDEEDPQTLQEMIRHFRHTGDGNGPRINTQHLRALAEKMAEGVEHIEASISEWSKNSGTPKRPLPIDRLLELEFTGVELALTAKEYMDLEFGAKDRQLRREWRQSIPYRAREGRSVLFRCTSEPEVDDETHAIEGQLWIPGDDDAEYTESSISEGDWVVMTPVDDSQDPPVEVGVNRASDIARMPLVHIESISSDGSITVSAPWNGWDHWPSGGYDYLHSHHRYLPRSDVDLDTRRVFKNDYDRTRVVIDEDAAFILDPAHDDVVSYHCGRALQRSDSNHVLHWLNDLLTGARADLETDFCAADLIEGEPESFIESKFVEAESIDFEPNEPQRRFIRETGQQLVIVQGPPGTGKTSYTTSPAVLGRAYAFEKDDNPFTAAVSALSHDAVDELFEKVCTVAADCRDDDCFDKMKLVRVRPSSLPDEADPYDRRDDDQLVEHIAYHHEEGEGRLRHLYEQFVLEAEDDDPTQFVLFGPPTSIRGAVDKIAPLLLDVEDLDRQGDEDYDPSVWELIEEGDSDLFDLTVVDEASMMDLPLLFLVGAFAHEDGQLMLAGDHRQMQPIRTHDWESETRETIEDTVPFLSALDFVRFLKGDITEMEYIERQSPELDVGLGPKEQEEAVLPIYPLEDSFRLPQPVANLLTELFYEKDGIELGGLDDREPIPSIDTDNDLVREVANPDEWVSVVVHSGERDERSSDIERAITEAVLDEFDVVPPADEDLAGGKISAGVVVPFTAQRDKLQGTLDDVVQAQTVEKFQGGERDLILMSMVASDPGYVNQLSEFLLSPYRFNVAASRMKRKLIIVASEAVFQTSHPNADRYEDQLAWKRLYELTGALDESVSPAARGEAHDFDTELAENTTLELYHVDLPEK